MQQYWFISSVVQKLTLSLIFNSYSILMFQKLKKLNVMLKDDKIIWNLFDYVLNSNKF